LVDSGRERHRIVVGANDDPGMGGRLQVEPNEVSAVEGQHPSAQRRGVRQNMRVVSALLSGLLDGQNVVAQSVEFFDRGPFEILVGVQTSRRHSRLLVEADLLFDLLAMGFKVRQRGADIGVCQRRDEIIAERFGRRTRAPRGYHGPHRDARSTDARVSSTHVGCGLDPTLFFGG